MKKVAFHTQKGGTGKTTLAGNCGYAASEKVRTVLIDGDPQGNLTSWLLREPPRYELADVLEGKVELSDALVSRGNGLSILPTFAIGGDLQRFADHGSLGEQPFIFEDLCEKLKDLGTELVIFDLSPGMRLLERYALLSVDEVVTPLTPEFFSLDGVETFSQALDGINKNYRKNVRHRLIVANQVNRSFRRHRLIYSRLQKLDYEMITVPQDARIAEAQLVHETIFGYDPKGKAIKPIREIARALIEG